ncbi:hypothetical protein WJX81_003395 [Elliptochloris bilobata]|uniref:Uncharacterized protein n=1 Tax=Elliptochloris bilobata TaxID=381761 RepID=A0AAW1S176_9CHLO
MGTKLDEWELVSEDGVGSQPVGASFTEEEEVDAGDEQGTYGCEEYECLLLLHTSSAADWCSWVLSALFSQVSGAARHAALWALGSTGGPPRG